MIQEEKRYTIKLDTKTTVQVRESHLFKDRWIEYFGSIEKVEEFIKQSNTTQDEER
jgi:hypothetical protein